MTHGVQSTALGHPQEAVLRYLHLAFSNLKTWYAGTFHGRVEAKHLQGYLNEFCFRFNRRDDLFTAFQTVLGIAGRVRGPTLAGLYSEGPGRFVHPNPHEPEEPYDYVVASGIFGYAAKDTRARIRPTLERLFGMCKVGVAVNFLSACAPSRSPARLYLHPADVLQFALALTPAVRLDHTYMPNDFTLCMYRDPSWSERA